MGISLKEESRRDWNSLSENPDREELKMGALFRIADAVEAMSQNHVELTRQRDLYHKLMQEEREETARLGRVISSLRGVITKMKRRG
jgi:hypothetical protein